MSNRIPSVPSRSRTGKPVSNRGRLIDAILKIHTDQGRQRRRVLEAPAPLAPEKTPESSPRIEPQGPRDGATGA